MRVRKVAVPVAIISALILLGGVTAGLIWAKDQVAKDQVPSEPPTVLEYAGHPQEAPPPARPMTVSSSTSAPAATAEPAPMTGPSPEPTPEPAAQADPPAEGSSSSPSGPEGPGRGTVYTWKDGDRTMRALLLPDPPDPEPAAKTSEDEAARKGKEGANPWKPSQHRSYAPPVFRSESGGERMTLPGGVLLALDPVWDRDAVESFFSRNGIPLERTSELDFLDNGFFVETGPGFPSLELANALADQEGVVLSSPNWAREMELK